MELYGKSIRGANSPFDCLLFDLDDTLYSSTAGIAQACRNNIEEFLLKKCGFEAEKASSLRVELFKSYGSTLAGLRALGYDISSDDYHSFVHGRLPYEVFKPDQRLRNLLRSITIRKLIFTNSDGNHARKVLERLGIADCFEQIICFETLNPNISTSKRLDEFPVVLKPSIDAMEIAIEAAGTDPHRTLFFDDNVRNIAAGKSLGLHTVLVGNPTKTKEADYLLESIHNVVQVIPEIWVGGEKKDDEEGIVRTRSVESMLATTPVGA